VTGILMYDLAGNWCEECGQLKMQRAFSGLTDCGTCNEAITRHRCTKRPDLGPGQSWECPDCGTAWTAGEEEETCGECGQGIGTMRKTWDSVPGDRIDDAPRHAPEPVPLWTPFRDLLPRRPAIYDPPGPFGECYTMASGAKVHVRPGCRCKT
jgi:hypothetical protein